MDKNLQTTIKFLNYLARGGLITVNSLDNSQYKNPSSKQFTTAEEAAAWVHEESRLGRITYFTCQEMQEVKEGRGRFSDVTAIRMVPFEFDTKLTKIRPATDVELVPALEAAQAYQSYMKEMGLGRPMLVHSGSGGTYPLLFFVESKLVATNEERHRVSGLLKRFHRHMHDRFASEQVAADAMVDLPRFLGLPGLPKNKLKGLKEYTPERPNRIVTVLDWGEPTTWEKFEAFTQTLPEIENEDDSSERESLSVVELPEEKIKTSGRAVQILSWDDEIRKKFNDDQSTAEYVAAVLLAEQKFNDNEIYTALTRFSKIRDSNDPKLHRADYYIRTISKARSEFEQEKKHLTDAIRELGLQPEPAFNLDNMKSEPSTPKTPEGNRFVEQLASMTLKNISVYNLTDSGNAERLVARFGKYIRFVYNWKKWLVFDGARWAIDDGDYIATLALTTARAIQNEADNISDDETKNTLMSFAMKSESRAKLDSMTILAQRHNIEVSKLDSDKMLFNVENGTLDLRTGNLRPFDHVDFITMMAGTHYDPKAQCPNWLAFLEKVMPDPILREHLQRFLGYSLTGETGERAFRLDVGQLAKNGKSTLYKTIRALFKDYGISVSFDTFGTKSEGKIRNDLASLVGKRLVIAVEAGRDFELDVNTVKSITGNDEITARFLFREFFSFYPQFKIWLSGNNKPTIKDGGNAIWDRLHLVEWPYRFSDAEEIKDFSEKMLIPELPGILNWALEGCLQWQKEGLSKPDAVRTSIEDYRAEQWPLTDFVRDSIDLVAESEEHFSDLYQAYVLWCSLNDIRQFRNKNFASALREKFEYRILKGRSVYKGLKLRPGTGI